MTGPKLLPSPKRKEQRVFLEPEVWDELTDAAEFHTEVFQVMGADEVVSRNDLIASFLDWALQEYWDDKGGKPTSKQDRAEKARKHAEKLRASPSPKK